MLLKGNVSTLLFALNELEVTRKCTHASFLTFGRQMNKTKVEDFYPPARKSKARPRAQ
jgi:hypothetical protein